MACRLCYTVSEDFIEIFSEEKISKYIKKFLDLEVNKDDQVSKVICAICWHQLKIFQSFYMRIHEVQRRPQLKLKKESSLNEKELAEMEESGFEYVNTEADADLHENSEIMTAVEEDDYPESGNSESDFENTSLEPLEFHSNSQSNKRSTKRGTDSDNFDEKLKESDRKRAKLDYSSLEDLILKVHSENKAMIHRVTCEILEIKKDVRKIQADITFKQNDSKTTIARYPFTAKLPFKDRESFLSFENECVDDPELLQTLQSFYKHEDPSNSKAFLRNNLKKMITDEAAVMFSWQGTEHKTQIKNLHVFDALKNSFREVFPKSSDMFANNILKQHFQHASDRIKKRKINL